MNKLMVFWKNIHVADLEMKSDKSFEYTLIESNLTIAKRQGAILGILFNSKFNGSFPEWIIDRIPKRVRGSENMFVWLSQTGGRLQTDKISFRC